MTDQQPSPVFAALDLGSNSFHLLVARCQDGKLEVIDRHKEMVRLASGLNDDGTLSEDAANRALRSLERFAERLRSTPNAHVHIVGTNTLRAASRTDNFLHEAEQILGNPINIISGIEEARLIYRGVVHDLAPTDHQRLVVDIGGGSTELIIGNLKPRLLESLYMGCVSYTKRFFENGVVSAKNYRKALLSARDEVQTVAEDFHVGHWSEAVGTSGSIRAILSMLEAMGISPEHTISLAGLETLASKIVQFPHVDKIDLPGLSDDRRPVIIGGLAVLHGAFIELGIEQMQVSSYALREGIVLDLAGLLEDKDIRIDTVNRMMEQYRVDVEHANRVEELAMSLLAQVRDDFGVDYFRARKALQWAACLHEVGLSVSHASYNKHSAYLLEHSEMPGFSRQEQKLLSFLVLNHRRKLRPMNTSYGFVPDWRLVQILRLSCLLCRRRIDDALPPELSISFGEGICQVSFDGEWLNQHPLTFESLLEEQSYQANQNLQLDVVSR